MIVFEPPERIVLDWQISAEWGFDPSIHTEVEVRFADVGEGTTRVELEHRGLEAFGEQAEQMSAIFDSPEGWSEILERYATTAG